MDREKNSQLITNSVPFVVSTYEYVYTLGACTTRVANVDARGAKQNLIFDGVAGDVSIF
jgi:hypothetical protein